MKKRDVRLNTDAHREVFGDFFEAFQAVSRQEGWRSSEVLRHFTETSFRAIRGQFLIGEAWEKNEAEYMRVQKLCRHPQETLTNLSVMLGAMTLALSREPVDFLGPVFTEIAADAGLGQFFTPWHVSYLIAKMTIPERAEALKDGRRFVSMQEPACGVGGMILASNLALREAGYDVAREVHWFGVDIDRRAICGAYLQAALTDCSGVFVHGNALSLETWESTLTPAALAYPKVQRRDATKPPGAPPVEYGINPKTGQMEMF